jgi:glucose-1-phosphate thymidylyltransferase
MAVILGDNIFQDDLSPYVERFREQGRGARLLLKSVGLDDAKRFGVAEIKDGSVTRIVEKPTEPVSDLVVTGFYMYDADVFDLIRELSPSARGEYEISDINNKYIDRGDLRYDILSGWWTDAGTPASKLKASLMVALSKGVVFEA